MKRQSFRVSRRREGGNPPLPAPTPHYVTVGHHYVPIFGLHNFKFGPPLRNPGSAPGGGGGGQRCHWVVRVLHQVNGSNKIMCFYFYFSLPFLSLSLSLSISLSFPGALLYVSYFFVPRRAQIPVWTHFHTEQARKACKEVTNNWTLIIYCFASLFIKAKKLNKLRFEPSR